MPAALLDTTVLFAAANARDAHHDAALPILRGVDAGDLPDGTEPIRLDAVPAYMADTKRSREEKGKNKEEYRRERDLEETLEADEEPPEPEEAEDEAETEAEEAEAEEEAETEAEAEAEGEESGGTDDETEE